jgi:uncharacterized protein
LKNKGIISMNEYMNNAVDKIEEIAEVLFESSITIGVTGLRRSGKTVFITSLIESLLKKDRQRLSGLTLKDNIESIIIKGHPIRDIAKFDFKKNRGLLRSEDPEWPEATSAISQIRLTLDIYNTRGLKFRKKRRLHVDILDYPGEWLLDLTMIGKTFDQWSTEVIAKLKDRPEAQDFLKLKRAQLDLNAELDEKNEEIIDDIRKTYVKYLEEIKGKGYSDCTPGRFTMPGSADTNSGLFKFFPCNKNDNACGRRSVWRELERRYNEYKSSYVTEFYTKHFSRIDRQVVLVDTLSALSQGPEKLIEMSGSLGEVLENFQLRKNSLLRKIVGGQKITKILLAASKADHLHSSQYASLQKLTSAMLEEFLTNAKNKKIQWETICLASVRCTTESETSFRVEGLLHNGRIVEAPELSLPKDPESFIFNLARNSKDWDSNKYIVGEFKPFNLGPPEKGFPHINIDTSLDFLIGDLL